MRKINQLDLFSGIGGFHLGFEKAGYKVKSYFSEIDKHAVAVYKHKFKNAEYVGSVTDVRGADLPSIDLITFGSPCQDFSLAGKRKGMGGERSSLILEAIRLIGECRPRVFIWENVKGTFSSNSGEDFSAIIKAFADIGGYRLEWQLLNTAWFLPQNRERIYLVGYSTNTKRNWRGVFPIGESTRQINEVRSEYQISNFSNFEFGWRDTSPTLCARDHKDPKIVKVKSEIKVGTWRTHKDGQGFREVKGGDCPTIPARAREDGSGQPVIKVKSATKAGYEIAKKGDAINLTAVNSTTRKGRVGKGKAQTLDTLCEQAVIQLNPSLESGGKQPYQQNRVYSDKGIVPALCQGKSDLNIKENYRIRRLTPIECERLQGFPDNHTEYGNYDGEVKKMSNTQRYKQCGNAVTTDVVQAIAEKIKPLFR